MREMKNSGVEWVGSIPTCWTLEKVKYHFANIKDIAGIRANDYERLALTMKGVIKRPKDDADGLQPADFNTYQILNESDLVFKLIDLQNVATSRVGLSPYTGLVSPAYIRLVKSGNINPKFAEYFFLMMWKNEVFNHLGDSGVRSSLNSTDLLNIPICVPNLDEQTRIANFLDSKCAEIDALMADIQAQIEILEQYKRSVITEAVTKGLDPNVEMKDSGIEWIGEVPAHWDVLRFKYAITAFTKGNGITKEDIVIDGDSPCVRYGEIYTKYNQSFNNCVTRTDKQKLVTPRYFSYGDILFVGTGELIEEIGKSIVYLGHDECLAGGDIIIAKHKQNPAFLNYAVNSHHANAQKGCGKMKLKVVHISSFDIGNVVIALPSYEEQGKITGYLDAVCLEVDASIATKKEQLSTLDAYKKSLIYEYVTGKKEVPEYVG